MTVEILIAVALSGMVATIICWLAMPIGNFLGLLDKPDADRKLHGQVTPLVGGLAIIIPSAAISLMLSNDQDRKQKTGCRMDMISIINKPQNQNHQASQPQNRIINRDRPV